MSGAVKSTPEVLSQPDGMRSRPIDLVYLSRQTLGDPGLETEILSLFSEMAAAYLKKVTDSGDPAEIAIGLHSLKGAAAGIGAGSLAAEAKAAESEMQETGALSAERLGDLAIAVEEVRAFISGLLGK